jgi:hypothetical protein
MDQIELDDINGCDPHFTRIDDSEKWNGFQYSMVAVDGSQFQEVSTAPIRSSQGSTGFKCNPHG